MAQANCVLIYGLLIGFIGNVSGTMRVISQKTNASVLEINGIPIRHNLISFSFVLEVSSRFLSHLNKSFVLRTYQAKEHEI